MKNPLRRAYNKLSRLIVNEGFKDFAKLYGFDPKDSNYQEVKDAYNDIKKNKELKDYYKAKLDKNGIDRSNLDMAYTNLFPTPEDFLNSYNEFQSYYKEENALATLRRQREKLKAKYAGNIVQETADYVVYEVRTFKEAKQMRWLWMGDVPKLTNAQCRKIDPYAPGDSCPYKGGKTPEEMADYLMTNNEFIMNPSWCVCAAKDLWEEYGCGYPNDDGSVSCYLIFSKKYPNARFCVVKNIDYVEVRDPWQAGDFYDEYKVDYGLAVMEKVFGKAAVNEIECLQDIDDYLNQ